jgi:hypothetical protein
VSVRVAASIDALETVRGAGTTRQNVDYQATGTLNERGPCLHCERHDVQAKAG